MGTQISKDPFIGEVGNVIGYRGLDGKYLVRAAPSEYHYPHTPEQVVNNNAFALAGKLVSLLDPLLREVNMANGVPPNRHGKKVSMLIKYCTNLPQGQFAPIDLPIVNAPGVDLHFKELSLVQVGNTFMLHAAIDPRLSHRLFRGVAVILLYNPQQQIYYPQPTDTPTAADLVVKIPDTWQPQDVQAVAYILLAFKKKGISDLPFTINPATDKLSDLQYIEWSQVHTVLPQPPASSGQ